MIPADYLAKEADAFAGLNEAALLELDLREGDCIVVNSPVGMLIARRIVGPFIDPASPANTQPGLFPGVRVAEDWESDTPWEIKRAIPDGVDLEGDWTT